MQEEVDLLIETAQEDMERAMVHLQEELVKVRTGKASPSLVSGIFVDYYGASTPLAQIANIGTPDARTITIQPWEKNMIKGIENAIFEANIGITPQNDGIVIRLMIPPLTEERRREMAKKASSLAEQAKVSVRNARRDAIEGIKALVKKGYAEDLGKRAEEKVQTLTNEFTAKSDKLFEAKEKEIMTI